MQNWCIISFYQRAPHDYGVLGLPSPFFSKYLSTYLYVPTNVPISKCKYLTYVYICTYLYEPTYMYLVICTYLYVPTYIYL